MQKRQQFLLERLLHWMFTFDCMTHAPISPLYFAQAMERHWTLQLGNAPSSALRATWTAQARTFGLHILNHDDAEKRTEWHVLAPPTGSGKTQGTILYCSMMASMSDIEHPGVLIVTRLIEDADNIASEINRLSERPNYATSYHSGKKGETLRETLVAHPVLVITHSAYENALSNEHDRELFAQTWPFFYSWQNTGRKLVIIDEAPTFAKQAQVCLDSLRLTLGALTQVFRDEYPDETKALSGIVAIMEAKASEVESQEAVLPQHRTQDGGRIKLKEMIGAIREIKFDEQFGAELLVDNSVLQEQHRKVLISLQEVLNGPMYYAKVMRRGHTLNSSRLVIPMGIKGAVVLDATAPVNVSYELFDKLKRVPMPAGVRSYQAATIWVHRGRNVGKDYLAKHTAETLGPVLSDLNDKLRGRNVLIATHKAVEQKVLSEKTSFKRSVAHWGAIDGSNAWRDCDTAVILGLPSKPDYWAANVFFALQGMQDTDWLRTKRRAFGKHGDIRSALKTGQTIAEVVQAINRIRCRQVIDSEGNCPPVDVYILLPDGLWGDTILKGITQLMEGATVKPWVITGFEANTVARGRPCGKRSAFLPVLHYLKDMAPGAITRSELRNETAASDSTFKRFIAEATNASSEVTTTLKAWGISYVSTGKGRGAKSYFVKA